MEKARSVRKKAQDEIVVRDDIFALARSLKEIFNQSYALLKPAVDDACRHPETIGQDDLEHLFDATLDIANYKGKRLFDKLCKSFVSVYPDSVEDYIRIEREQNGEDVHSHFSRKVRIGDFHCVGESTLVRWCARM